MSFRYPFRLPTLSLLTTTFLLITTLLSAGPASANAAPRVRLDTVLGDVELELLHQDAPLTVTNFLNYVVTDRYDESFIHRSMPGFVIQGGGYAWPSDGDLEVVPRFESVPNEPGVSNTRGTVAMAKAENEPNSATSEYFFNLDDNLFLDSDNGGFTVFAEIVPGSMDTVDEIAGLMRVNAGAPFTDLPVRDLSGTTVERENLVLVNDVEVLSTGIEGDYNANGRVEQGDLDLVLLNWNQAAAPLPNGWFQQLPSGIIDQSELDGVLLNWGKTAPGGAAFSTAGVPEPSTWLLALAAAILAWAIPRNRRTALRS